MEQTSLNPWKSMWTQPRQTIREVLVTEPVNKAILLGMVGGILQSLDRAVQKNLGDRMSLIGVIASCIIAGAIGGLLIMYLGAWIIRVTGRWLGGKAEFEDIQVALGWASIIPIWTGILWIPELLLFGNELFKKSTPIIDASPLLSIIFFILTSIELALGVWGIVTLLKCLGEVQGFSAWRALLNVLLPFLIILGITVIIVLVAKQFR